MRKVLVLLSTYNGRQYLKEQLDSIYAQKSVDFTLLVRDDGSKDSTMAILEEYKLNFGRMDIIYGHNIGVGPSFMALIEEATRKYATFDYFAFCDQDDVWFDNKLAVGVSALEKSKKIYKLYFSRAINTDSKLMPLSCKAKGHFNNSFGANAVSNHILGCTMLFNNELLFEVNKINTVPFKIESGKIPIHDNWTAFVAYSLDADVVYNPKGMMYYRQHGNNVIGSGKGRIRVLINRIKRYCGRSNYIKSNRSIIALQVLGDGIPVNNKLFLELMANYRKNIKTKIRLLCDRRIYENNSVDNFGAFLLILLNKF